MVVSDISFSLFLSISRTNYNIALNRRGECFGEVETNLILLGDINPRGLRPISWTRSPDVLKVKSPL